MVEKEQGYGEAIDAAKEGIKSYHINNMALQLFKALVEKGQGYGEAIKVASAGMNNPDRNMRNYALELFKSLFENKQGFKEAINAGLAALEKVKNSNWGERISTYQLFKALVEKGQQIPVVKALKEKQLSIEEIMEITGLSREEIEG